MKYRKKPVVIDAIQWRGELPLPEEFQEMGYFERQDSSLVIMTLEGHMKCNIDDFVIKGVKGEFYPCKPDIFEMTYEKVEN